MNVLCKLFGHKKFYGTNELVEDNMNYSLHDALWCKRSHCHYHEVLSELRHFDSKTLLMLGRFSKGTLVWEHLVYVKYTSPSYLKHLKSKYIIKSLEIPEHILDYTVKEFSKRAEDKGNKIMTFNINRYMENIKW